MQSKREDLSLRVDASQDHAVAPQSRQHPADPGPDPQSADRSLIEPADLVSRLNSEPETRPLQIRIAATRLKLGKYLSRESAEKTAEAILKIFGISATDEQNEAS